MYNDNEHGSVSGYSPMVANEHQRRDYEAGLEYPPPGVTVAMPDAGRKDDTAKLRYDLIPPEPLREKARLFTFGAQKYGDWNWRNGIAYSRLYAALMRHLQAFWSDREDYDKESGVHHLIAVAWNAEALYEMQRLHCELDDRV